jgi:hypothetical protein
MTIISSQENASCGVFIQPAAERVCCLSDNRGASKSHRQSLHEYFRNIMQLLMLSMPVLMSKDLTRLTFKPTALTVLHPALPLFV